MEAYVLVLGRGQAPWFVSREQGKMPQVWGMRLVQVGGVGGKEAKTEDEGTIKTVIGKY